MQEDWNSIGGQHFKFISLDVGEKCESEEKRKDAELELIHSNDSVVYNIPRATRAACLRRAPRRANSSQSRKKQI